MSRRKLKYAVLKPLAPWVVSSAMWLLRSTLRIEIRNADSVLALDGQSKPIVFALWHGDMIAATVCYRYMLRSGLKRVAILTSLSEDGELLARMLKKLGANTVRGSSSRGARSGLRAMERYIETTGPVVVAVDGPRGPRHETKLGVSLLAKDTGALIVPVTFHYSRPWRLRTWDRASIPKPFSRCEMTFQAPIAVPADADRDCMERIRTQVEQALLGGTEPGSPESE